MTITKLCTQNSIQSFFDNSTFITSTHENGNNYTAKYHFSKSNNSTERINQVEKKKKETNKQTPPNKRKTRSISVKLQRIKP